VRPEKEPVGKLARETATARTIARSFIYLTPPDSDYFSSASYELAKFIINQK
jgi:hypothetical protein